MANQIEQLVQELAAKEDKIAKLEEESIQQIKCFNNQLKDFHKFETQRNIFENRAILSGMNNLSKDSIRQQNYHKISHFSAQQFDDSFYASEGEIQKDLQVLQGRRSFESNQEQKIQKEEQQRKIKEENELFQIFMENRQKVEREALEKDRQIKYQWEKQQWEQEENNLMMTWRLLRSCKNQKQNKRKVIRGWILCFNSIMNKNPLSYRFEEHKQPKQRQEQDQMKPFQNKNADQIQRNDIKPKQQQQIQQINRNLDDEYILPNSNIGFAVSEIVQPCDINQIRERLGKKSSFQKIFEGDSQIKNQQLINKLDGKKKLLLLVRAKRNYDNEIIGRFGAYISIPFYKQHGEEEQFFVDPEAFIISLDKGMIFNQINKSQQNIGFSSNSILIFGKQKEGSKSPKIQSMDLFLRDSYGVKKCSSNLGSSFEIPQGIDQKEGTKILTGLLLFSIDRIEVFQVGN
ncbi:UNKNOWN [Stylonychia lemnae]|uniref:TLDc domain-containing protein n=1 Tax=Stylonychia lemnae TaxID=5949 RepID=A0A078BAZ9_STYLE|nr:UNKNOWN [Stylonychia lemnae]|eukprot:CDW90412.1 UNKNOWN [Stylonychia lemnae]